MNVAERISVSILWCLEVGLDALVRWPPSRMIPRARSGHGPQGPGPRVCVSRQGLAPGPLYLEAASTRHRMLKFQSCLRPPAL